MSNKVSDMAVADTFIKRFLGYMFRREPHHQAIMIRPCNSIHTFFMKFDIDVLFINDDLEIVKKIEGLGPSRIIKPIKDASFVIEGRAGVFKDCLEGDKISIDNHCNTLLRRDESG